MFKRFWKKLVLIVIGLAVLFALIVIIASLPHQSGSSYTAPPAATPARQAAQEPAPQLLFYLPPEKPNDCPPEKPVRVSGYTRKDGKEVKSYCRRM